MKIGIFSQLESSGGSEHRVAEMANSIVRFTNHECFLIGRKNINNTIKNKLYPQVNIIENVFGHDKIDIFYQVDALLIITSDCYSFSKLEYWEGTTKHHNKNIDIGKIKQMIFLYNFVISPSKNLEELLSKNKNIKIITANRDYLNIIDKKFSSIKHLPKMFLESPIDENSISQIKLESKKIRIGKHSKAQAYKFNSQHLELILKINDKFKDKISWDFMGYNDKEFPNIDELKKIENITFRREYELPVKDYLSNIDIFLFFISWEREEPWSRAVAEAMLSGCPILATNKSGNIEQIDHGHNGFLCNTVDDFEKYLTILIETPSLINTLGRNSIEKAKSQFLAEIIIKKFIKFIE